MFTFEDKGGRSAHPAPRGHRADLPRLRRARHAQARAAGEALVPGGPFFRHEAPQAGRYRQFHQIGAEAIGTDSPLADAEVIILLARSLGELGVPGVQLRLGSLGSPESRAAYLEELQRLPALPRGRALKEVRERIDVNPLRAFDADDEGTQAVMADAPTLLDRLDGEDAAHFDAGAGAARRRRASPTRSTRPWCAASTTTRGPSSSSTAAARRPVRGRAAAGAMTAWSSSSAARRRRASAGRPASSGSCSRWRGGRRSRGPRRLRRGRRRRPSAAAPRRSSRTSAGRALGRDRPRRPQLKGQMKHADRVGARVAVILEDDGAAELRDMASGEQQRDRRRPSRWSRSRAAS